MFKIADLNDPLFLFTCRTVWLQEGNEEALELLRAASRSVHRETRTFAQFLLKEIHVPDQMN